MRSLVAWKAPDRTLIYADDPHDDTPFLVATHKDGGIYDPLQSLVRYRKGSAVPRFTAKLQDRNFIHDFGFGSILDEHGEPALNREIKIDITFV